MIVKTEWGVRSPWGDNAVADKTSAEKIVENMTAAGHTTAVIWRGVTPWVTEGDAEQ